MHANRPDRISLGTERGVGLATGKLPLGRVTRTQTMEPGEVGQRLVQSARGPTKRRPSLARRPKLKEDPPLLLVLDAGKIQYALCSIVPAFG